jgi:murein DD-endopeptidase MepM/ murein hydrolase activator NlpD
MTAEQFTLLAKKYRSSFFPVVKEAVGNVYPLDLSATNSQFTREIFNDMQLFDAFIEQSRSQSQCRFLMGGYGEDRSMYTRSGLFVSDVEPRSVHLGIDVWGAAGTVVTAPVDGAVHSFKFNDAHGDYGATIILKHELYGRSFYALYGHLSVADLQGLVKGKMIKKGDTFAHFGPPCENGNWPPHLHFQIIIDIAAWEGDYPGVCKRSEAATYLANSPDPAILLQL